MDGYAGFCCRDFKAVRNDCRPDCVYRLEYGRSLGKVQRCGQTRGLGDVHPARGPKTAGACEAYAGTFYKAETNSPPFIKEGRGILILVFCNFLFANYDLPLTNYSFLSDPQTLSSRKPHKFKSRGADNPLWELPISTIPWARTPVHTTFAYQFGRNYLETGMKLLGRNAGPHVFLFHAADLLDYPNDGPLMGNYLPLKWSLEKRIDLVAWVLKQANICRVITSEDMISSGLMGTTLPGTAA